MTTYSTHQEAKIANPNCDIYARSNGCDFVADKDLLQAGSFCFSKCNPADYCMTVEKFLADGHKFVEGDLVWHRDEHVEFVNAPDVWNKECADYDDEDQMSFILRAAALEEKKPRTKVEYVKCEFVSDKEKAEAFIEGGLRYFTHGEVRGDLERDTIPVTRLDELLCGNRIYRRIETPITWQEEAKEHLASIPFDLIDTHATREVIRKAIDKYPEAIVSLAKFIATASEVE